MLDDQVRQITAALKRHDHDAILAILHGAPLTPEQIETKRANQSFLLSFYDIDDLEVGDDE